MLRVKSQKQMAIMPKKLSVLAAALLICACNNGARKIGLGDFDQNQLALQPGGRLAAVLVKGQISNLSPTQALGQRANQTKSQNIQVASAPAPFSSLSAKCDGAQGYVIMIAAFEDQTRYRGVNQPISGRVQGRGTGVYGGLYGKPFAVPCVSEKSQITFSPTGALLWVTLPKLNQVAALPVGPTGTIDGTGMNLFDAGIEPTEIATIYTHDSKEIVAVANQNSISLFVSEAYDASFQSPYPTSFGEVPFGQNSPQALAFSPSGEYLFATTKRFAGGFNTTGGDFEVYHVPTLLTDIQPPGYSLTQRNRASRGYIAGSPRAFSSDGGPADGGFGSQPYGGGPMTKLAITKDLVVGLSPSGAYHFRTPNTGDMDTRLSDILGEANYFGRQGGFRGGFGNLATRFKDIVIHPFSKFVFALTDDSLVTFVTDDRYSLGTGRAKNLPSKAVALAMDPGPNPSFMAIATVDQIFLATLRQLGYSLNTQFDGFPVPTGTSPVDVTIKPNVQPRTPLFANDSSDQTKETDKTSTQASY